MHQGQHPRGRAKWPAHTQHGSMQHTLDAHQSVIHTCGPHTGGGPRSEAQAAAAAARVHPPPGVRAPAAGPGHQGKQVLGQGRRQECISWGRAGGRHVTVGQHFGMRPSVCEWGAFRCVSLLARTQRFRQPIRLPGQVLKKLRRLPWAECEPYLLKTLVRASYKGRFSQVRPAATQPSVGRGVAVRGGGRAAFVWIEGDS